LSNVTSNVCGLVQSLAKLASPALEFLAWLLIRGSVHWPNTIFCRDL
jgi:hypothetical protein